MGAYGSIYRKPRFQHAHSSLFQVFWSDFEPILGTWPHMARQRQRNWMYRKERCRQCAADVEMVEV